MFLKTTSDSLLRPIKPVIVAIAALCALSACGGGEGSSGANSAQGQTSSYEVSGDHAIGDVNAPVTVVEYASVVCGACANWHNTVSEDFKAKYVDTGKVRFVFREFPTSPEDMAMAGFLIANCAPEKQFFDNIKLQFKKQRDLLNSRASGTTRAEYERLAKASGLSVAEFETCLKDETQTERLETVFQGGIDAGVTGTPSFFINGKKEKVFTMEQFDEVLAPLLGEETPSEE